MSALTFFAILDRLYAFVLAVTLRVLFRDSVQKRGEGSIYLKESSPSVQEETTTTSPPADKGAAPDEPAPFKRVDTVMRERQKDDAADVSIEHTVTYVGTTDAPLFVNPTKEFDGIRTSIPYGAMVMVLEQKGRFAHIASDGVEGWMLREDLADRLADVQPELVVGDAYAADDPQTLRLRAAIRDMFGGSRVEYPLQSGEYVAYKLMRKGLTIPWPFTYARNPGRWHEILRGVTGIHIGIIPKTGAVLEYALPSGAGHVAYVEAVFPDETIVISEANYPDDGIYNERTLPKKEWQEFNPIFIQINA